MAPFRRAARHRPAARPQRQHQQHAARRAAEQARRIAEYEYFANLRHLR